MKIELEDHLIIEVKYYFQPFEPAETGPEAQYPGCPASIDDVTIMDIVEGSVDSLVYYVSENKNFYRELEEYIFEKIIDETQSY